MIVPYIFTFIQSVFLSSFRIKHSPPVLLSLWVGVFFKILFPTFSFLFLIQVHFIETCHTIGLSLLIFRILPSIDNVTGLFLMNGVCIVPSILNLFSSRQEQNSTMKILSLITDITAVLMQLSIVFIPYILPTADKLPSSLQWQIPLALFLISLGYWESFIESNFSKKHLLKSFQHQLRLLKKTRPKVYITVSLWKIFILISSATYFLPTIVERKLYWQVFQQIPIGDQLHRHVSFFDEYDDLFRVTNHVFMPCLIQILSSCVCYYTGRIACKVRRKKISINTYVQLGFNAMSWLFITIDNVDTCFIRIPIFCARITQRYDSNWTIILFG